MHMLIPETTAAQVPNQAAQKQLTLMLSHDKSEKGLADRQTDRYRIAQNSGGEKLWRINNFQLLARKTLANARFFSIDRGKLWRIVYVFVFLQRIMRTHNQ